MKKIFDTEKFSLIANNLFLDFVNTKKMRDGRPLETLERFGDFLSWTVAVKLIGESEAAGLLEKWDEKPATADFLREAIEFRDLLRETADRIARRQTVTEKAVAAINAQLAKQSGFVELETAESGFEKRFRFDLSEPSRLLKPIAEAAADFLCYANFEFLRKCESDACVLYFYDTTKNHRRRWCSMSGCGNKAKAAAFYQRKKQAVKN